MLYGGVAWSELPISTQKQAVPNGNEETFEGEINLALMEELEINSGEEFGLEIDTQPAVELLVRTAVLETVQVKTQIEFELQIDPEQVWSLS
jgi:hypothetical protein